MTAARLPDLTLSQVQGLSWSARQRYLAAIEREQSPARRGPEAELVPTGRRARDLPDIPEPVRRAALAAYASYIGHGGPPLTDAQREALRVAWVLRRRARVEAARISRKNDQN